jgi:hypothetical protein
VFTSTVNNGKLTQRHVKIVQKCRNREKFNTEYLHVFVSIAGTTHQGFHQRGDKSPLKLHKGGYLPQLEFLGKFVMQRIKYFDVRGLEICLHQERVNSSGTEVRGFFRKIQKIIFSPKMAEKVLYKSFPMNGHVSRFQQSSKYFGAISVLPSW